MELPTPRTDKIFKIILLFCVGVMVLSAIAWACGWEGVPFLIVGAGGFINVPLFHFAMHWPFRKKKDAKDERGNDTEE